VLAGAIYSLKVGKELDQDPEYLKRVANHEFSTEHYEAKGVENQMKAALSVSIFVLATIAIVIFGSMESLRPVFTVGTEKVSMQMSHIIEVLMLTASAFILLFTKTDGIKAAQGSVFSAGMQAVVAIFGIAWMGDTFIAGNMTELKGSIEHIVTQMPWLFGLALFVMSILLFSQVATIRAMKRQVLAAYIISTVRNTSINRLKAIEYEREHVVEDSDIELESISTEDLLERFIQLSEDLKALSLIWTKLSREDQSLLEGKYILGYNNKELAEMFHCQHSSIRMKLTRARRNAFALLTEQECCVSEIADKLMVSQSAISHQLQMLRYFNVVKTDKKGQNVIYSLADDHIRIILRYGLEHIKEEKNEKN